MSGRARLFFTDEEVDPVFRCRLCKTTGYVDESAKKRTPDPLDPTGQKPLAWLSHRYCTNCDLVLEVAYRWDTAPGGKLSDCHLKRGQLIRRLESDVELMTEFLTRKEQVNKANLFSVNSTVRTTPNIGELALSSETLCIPQTIRCCQRSQPRRCLLLLWVEAPTSQLRRPSGQK